MFKLLRRVEADCDGATAIEYGLIAAFVALAIVAALPAIKTNLGSVFSNINTQLEATATSSESK